MIRVPFISISITYKACVETSSLFFSFLLLLPLGSVQFVAAAGARERRAGGGGAALLGGRLRDLRVSTGHAVQGGADERLRGVRLRGLDAARPGLRLL